MESELRAQPFAQHEPGSHPLLEPEPETSQLLNPEPNQTAQEMDSKYAPFVRYDVYGPMGRGELPCVEKFLLLMALMFLVPMRVMAGLVVMAVYYVICRVCTAFLTPNTKEDEQEDYAHMGGWRRAVIMGTGRFLSRVMLFVLGFYWISETKVGGELSSEDQSEEAGGPGVIRELKSSDIKGVSAVISDRIQEAHQDKSAPKMMIFPEGTTTNGDYLLPFKTGAFLAQSPVLPIILRYPFQRFSPAWESISGARHVILLLCQFANYIEVTKLPVYHPSEEEKADPKLYAENVRRLIAREANLILSDAGLAEKRVYLEALNGNISTPTVLHHKDD